MKRAAGVFGRRIQQGAVLTMVVASAAVSCARIAGIDGTYTRAGSGGQPDESFGFGGATGGGAGGVQGKGGTQDGSGATSTGGRVNSSGGKTSSEGGNVAEGGATGTPATGGSGGGASGALTSGGNSAQGGALTSGGSPAQGGALTSGGSGGFLHEGVPTAIGGAGGAQGGGGGGHAVAGSGGAPICDEGAPRCLSSTQSQICQNGAWAKTETCAVLETCTMNQCRCSFATCGTACTDLSTNASNCGVCGHSCQGGLCSGGHCQPVVLVSGQTNPGAIATDGTTLFWTGVGGLHQYTFATRITAVVDLSTEPPQCGWLTSIIQYGGSLYWNGTYTCSMMLPPPQTINSMIFGSLSNDLHSIVGTTNGLFAYDDDATEIVSSRSGYYQAPEPGISAIAADNATLYWVENTLGGPPNLKQHNLISDLSSGTTTLVSGLWIRQLAAYASFAYFTTFTSQTDTTGLVYRIQNIPGNSPTMLAAAQLNPTDIVADASGVYWINGSATNGQIMRASLTGGDATPIATGQAGPYAITTDANNVYWTNQAGGQIMKVAK